MAIRTEVVSTSEASRSASEAAQASSTPAKSAIAVDGGASGRSSAGGGTWGVSADEVEARKASTSSLCNITERLLGRTAASELLLAAALARALQPELNFQRESAGHV